MFGPRSLLFYLSVFALALIIPLFAVATIATYRFADAERTRLEAMANSADQEIATLVDREITTRAALLRALSTARSLQSGDYPRFEVQLRELARLEKIDFVVFDLSGQQLVNTRAAPGQVLPRSADPDLLRSADTPHDIYVSNLFQGAVTDRPMLQVALPIARDGEVVAILSTTFFPERLVRLVKEGLPPGPFYGTILDRNGIIIARSILPEQYIGKPLPALAEGSRGRQGSLDTVNAQGVPIFLHYRRPEVSGWVIAAAVERSALTAPLTRSLTALSGTAAVLALLALGVATWVGLKILRAQRALVEAAESVGAGRVIAPPATPLREADWIGYALAEASHAIAEQAGELQRTNQALEARVEARTRELAAKTALLETTLDTMTQGLIVIDGAERIAVCNRQARTLLDLPDALMDTHPTIEDLLAFKDARGEFAPCPNKSFQLLKPKVGDELSVYERERPNGIVLQVATVPIRGGAGFVRTYSDVTESRCYARQLEEAKSAAEAASRAKGEFLANISHEMRTPLNAVIGYSDLLLKSSEGDGHTQRYASRIHGAGSALLSLVDDVLDLGKIEAGVIDIRSEPFQLDALLSDVLAIVRPTALDKGLHLTETVDVWLDTFVSDRNRLGQVLLNLLGNAIKFTPAGSIALAVRQQEALSGRCVLRFSVTDTGIGIAPSEQAALFQRFHQVDPSMQRRYGGAGLGLAISKQLVERLGGRIGVESEPGCGSTFWFEVEGAPASQATDAHARPAPSEAGTTSGGARVLVVEDVVLNQELARELLEEAGYTVDVVANGRDAVAAAEPGAYDAILMDLSMPEMDGLTAARRIREMEGGGRRTPIIACTANVVPAQVMALHETGIDAYLRKPLRSAELYAIVAQVLEPAAASRKPSNDERWAKPDTGDLRELVRLLGPERVVEGVETLCEELRRLAFDDHSGEAGRRHLAERAHALISTTCLLGLTELTSACRALEDACLEGPSFRPALDRLLAAIERAVESIVHLKTEVVEAAA